ncbi:MAG: hypothetical protein ACD_87C00178G0003 [uncultured bacterium]|nr:MAG: hypothetical protein ACD_87C00178G0003 [uncultured bacterium]
MVMTISEAFAASFGESAHFAPASIRGPPFSRVRFHTVKGYPAVISLRDMTWPIVPRPMNPILSMLPPSND